MMVGKLIGEHYQAILELSNRGFAQTYLAQDTYQPGHPPCVVKYLPRSAADDDHLLQISSQMLTREAEVLRKLGTHSQIPQLLDFYEEQQELYLVQEFIAGSPLSMELSSSSYWSESWVIQFLQEVLEILEFVHGHGIVHQDIEPDNLIRRKQDRQLVLINFSSVEQLPKVAIPAHREQVNTTDAAGQPHPRSDIYALGAIGIQALTGLRLTQLPEFDIGKVLQQSPAQVSHELAFVLSKMVHHQIEDSYQSVTEVLQALRPLAYRHSPVQQEASLQPSIVRPNISSQAPVTTAQISQVPTEKAITTVSTPTGSQSGNPNPRAESPLLIGISMGVTTVALGTSLIYLLWLFAATPKDQKHSVSPAWGEIAEIRVN